MGTPSIIKLVNHSADKLQSGKFSNIADCEKFWSIRIPRRIVRGFISIVSLRFAGLKICLMFNAN
jgi:hypothetical protein